MAGQDEKIADFVSGCTSIGGTTLDCIHWILIETHQSVTFGSGWDTID